MVNEVKRKATLNQIRENITRSGHHIYVVSGGATPRFAYTIGISESIGIELILAGAVFYMKDEVLRIINDIAGHLKTQPDRRVFEVTELGSFILRKVDGSWATEFMLGAFDYYQKRDIPALQIVPDKAHWSIDIPNMSAQWNPTTEPVWRWLKEPWTYPVPEDATATTDLAALRGERVTEAMRWEEDDWEIFVGDGPNIPKDELRVVPLGTLVGADESVFPVVNLAIGEGLLRDDPDSEWRPWRKRQQGIVQ
jgi:hypothetical protein